MLYATQGTQRKAQSLMTNQELINLEYKHFVEEGNPRAFIKSTGSCKYRRKGTDGCAIGIIIPDSLYSKTFENNGIDDIFGSAFNDSESEFRGSEFRGDQVAGDKLIELLLDGCENPKNRQDLLERLQVWHDTFECDLGVLKHIARDFDCVLSGPFAKER